MSSAAFSIPNGSQPKVALHRRVQSPATATSAAADEAIRQIIDQRRRRHKYGREPQLRASAVGQAINVVVAPIHESIRRLGLARWVFTTIVISAVGIVLTGAVAAKMLRSGPPCPVHRVTGRLLIGKSIPVGAQIRLHPKAGSLPDSALPKASVREDGTFEFSTFGRNDGVPAGDYVATMQWFRVRPDGSVGGNVLPARYASPAKSPLSVTIKAGANELPPFKITK